MNSGVQKIGGPEVAVFPQTLQIFNRGDYGCL